MNKKFLQTVGLAAILIGGFSSTVQAKESCVSFPDQASCCLNFCGINSKNAHTCLSACKRSYGAVCINVIEHKNGTYVRETTPDKNGSYVSETSCKEIYCQLSTCKKETHHK